MSARDFDAVIVGSGPGGATVADVLTEAGWSVCVFEKGRNHLIDLDHPHDLLGDYSNDEIKFMVRHFLGPDPFLEPRTFRMRESDGDRLFVGDVNNIPSTLGGGGPHADGKLPRFREEDFALASTRGPIDGAELADWPLGYDDLEPHYTEAEALIGVAGDAGANPFAAPRSAPYPMPPGPPMYGATLTSAAAAELGYHPYPAPTGANSVPYDGRPACVNCGFCGFYGCPIHAKGDPVASLRRALLTGRCEVRPETFVSRILVRDGRATGVEYLTPEGETRTEAARHVIVAAGAMETPRLLLLSGLDHPLVGRNLMFHFQTYVMGHFPQHLHSERGRSVTHLHDDHILPDDESLAAARDAGLPFFRGGTVEHTGAAQPILEAKGYPWGPNHKESMRRSPLRAHLFGFCMQAEDMPQATNRVDLDPTVRDVRGFPVARVTYLPHRHEQVASSHYAPKLAEILTRAGAEWTVASTSPDPNAPIGFHDMVSPVPQSKHVMGTARMGRDPATSVVDGWGRLHGVPNVVVADSSVFVTSAGYNPTLTLVALAIRAARSLIDAG